MIRSMTAFARVEQPIPTGAAVCEIRSVNGKNLDISVRLPQGFSEKEETIKKTVGLRIVRGRVEINVGADWAGPASPAYTVDMDTAKAYLEGLCRLRDDLGLAGEIDLSLIAAVPGLIKVTQPQMDIETIWPYLLGCIESAIDALCAMRAREGEFLESDFQKRLESIEGFLKEIAQESEGLLPWYQQRLVERIGLLVGNQVALDPGRVAQEAAFLASKSDIAEELTRLNTHIAHFRSIMAEPEPSGRKLNFLIQEMHREINTIGSKTEKAGVAHRVVDIKAELEKLREQVQNVE